MSNQKRDYDSTIARIAGNIMAGLVVHPDMNPYSNQVVSLSVAIARLIVAEVKRTEPAPKEPPC